MAVFDQYGNITRCAEDTVAEQAARSQAETRKTLELIETLRGIKGLSEDDEDGMKALWRDNVVHGRDPRFD